MITTTASPPACSLAATGGICSHQLANVGEERFPFKVKSSINKEYRFKPVFGFVEARSQSRLTRPPREDKAVIHFAIVPPGVRDAQDAFTSAATSTTITIPLSAAH